MRTRTKTLVATAAVVVVGAVGAATALGGGGDAESGERAGDGPGGGGGRRPPRCEATGGGTANAVERDGEDGATWEVEVTKPDGQTVDVRLGADLSVVVIEGDREDAAGDRDDGADDD